MGTEILDSDAGGRTRPLEDEPLLPAPRVVSLDDDPEPAPAPRRTTSARVPPRAGPPVTALHDGPEEPRRPGLHGLGPAVVARLRDPDGQRPVLRYAAVAGVAALVTGLFVQTEADRTATRVASSALSVVASGEVGVGTGDGTLAGVQVLVVVTASNLGPRAVRLGGVTVAAGSPLMVSETHRLGGSLPSEGVDTGSVTLTWQCGAPPPTTSDQPLDLVVTTADGERHEVPVDLPDDAMRRFVDQSCTPQYGIVDISSEVVDAGRAVKLTYRPSGQEVAGDGFRGALTVAGVPGVDVTTSRDLPVPLGRDVVTLVVRPVVTDCAEIRAHPEMLTQVGRLSITQLGEWGVPEGFGVVVGAAVARACP